MSNVAANIGREEGEKVDQNCNVTRCSFIFKLLNCAIAHTRWLAMSFADYTQSGMVINLCHVAPVCPSPPPSLFPPQLYISSLCRMSRPTLEGKREKRSTKIVMSRVVVLFLNFWTVQLHIHGDWLCPLQITQLELELKSLNLTGIKRTLVVNYGN